MAQALAPTLAPTPISSPASAEDALLGCLLRAAHPGQLGPASKGFASSILQDVQQIVGQGRPALLCALCDLHRLVLAALARFRLKRGTSKGRQHAADGPRADAVARADAPGPSTAPALRSGSLKDHATKGLLNQGPMQSKLVDGLPADSGEAHLRSAVDADAHGTMKRSHSRWRGKVLLHAERKVWFYVCWVNEQRPAMAALLHQSVVQATDDMSVGCPAGEPGNSSPEVPVLSRPNPMQPMIQMQSN